MNPNSLKRVWFTLWPTSSRHLPRYTLSFGSERTDPKGRIQVNQNTFPANPDPDHQLRHVVTLSLLCREDIELLRDACNSFLKGN